MRIALVAASSWLLACSLDLPAERVEGDAPVGGGGSSDAGSGAGNGGAGGDLPAGGGGSGGTSDWCAGIVPIPLLCADFNAGSLQDPFGAAGVSGGDFVGDTNQYTSAPRSVRFIGTQSTTAYFREAIYTSYSHVSLELDLRIEETGGASRVHVAAVQFVGSVVTIFFEGATLGVRESQGTEWVLTTSLAPQTWYHVAADFNLGLGTGQSSLDGRPSVSTPLTLMDEQQIEDFWIGFPYNLPAGSWAVQLDNVVFDAF